MLRPSKRVIAAFAAAFTCSLLFLSLLLFDCFPKPLGPAPTGDGFELAQNKFWIEGKEVNLYAGSFHYFRLPEVYWKERLGRMKEMGLNTVQFYIPWNLAEAEGVGKGEHKQSHIRFIELASSLGFYLLVRPGPYVCGEWDFGGLPARLQKLPKIRTFDQPYLAEVEAFWAKLLPPLKPYLYAEHPKSGKILMVQIENEFGSYGNVQSNPNDKKYLDFLYELAVKHLGKKTQYYTTDNYLSLGAGGIHDPAKNVYHVGDFGPSILSPSISFFNMRRWNQAGKSPDFVSEYYTGWMTAWKDAHYAVTSTEEMIATLKKLPNFNLYMAFGGTNFGFSNGLNIKKGGFFGVDLGQPQVTSYDYNAPIAEDGSDNAGTEKGSDKFLAIQQEIAGRSTRAETKLQAQAPSHAKPYPDVFVLKRDSSLLSAVDVSNKLTCKPVALPPIGGAKSYFAHEEDVFDHVFLYRFTPHGCVERRFELSEANDRVYVYVGGKLVKKLDREDSATASIKIGKDECLSEIDFLVENYGRQNFSPEMGSDKKGFTLSATPATATTGSFHLCHKLHDRILETHYALAADTTSTPRGGGTTTTNSINTSSSSCSQCWESYNKTREQMRYIFPLMDQQDQLRVHQRKEAPEDKGPVSSSAEDEVVVITDASASLAGSTFAAPSTEEKISTRTTATGALEVALPLRAGVEAGAVVVQDAATTSTRRNSAMASKGAGEQLHLRDQYTGGPQVYTGTFASPSIADFPHLRASKLNNTTTTKTTAAFLPDTFLDLRGNGLAKGIVVVNGMHLGRYWTSAGPVYSLYLPGVMLKPDGGENVITLVEFEGEVGEMPEEFHLKSSGTLIYNA